MESRCVTGIAYVHTDEVKNEIGEIVVGKIIKLKALKYPNILHYEWQGELLEQLEDYVVVLSKPGRKLIHHTKNKIFTVQHTSLEFFYLKEWYTVSIEIEKGKITSYYCNVAMPSVLYDDELRFVDLDLDLVKPRNQDWQVVDEDEFKQNSLAYNYPEDLKENAVAALERLKAKALNASYPFDETALRKYLSFPRSVFPM